MAHASTISLVAVKLNEGQVQSVADDTVSLLLDHQLICKTRCDYHMRYSTLRSRPHTTVETYSHTTQPVVSLARCRGHKTRCDNHMRYSTLRSRPHFYTTVETEALRTREPARTQLDWS